MVDMTLKTNILEAMFDGTVAFVVVTDTGSDLERESILASSRILGQNSDGDWQLELSISDEHGEKDTLIVAGNGVSFVDVAIKAHIFVRTYQGDPKAALDIFYGIRDAGCECGECYPSRGNNARA